MWCFVLLLTLGSGWPTAVSLEELLNDEPAAADLFSDSLREFGVAVIRLPSAEQQFFASLSNAAMAYLRDTPKEEKSKVRFLVVFRHHVS